MSRGERLVDTPQGPARTTMTARRATRRARSCSATAPGACGGPSTSSPRASRRRPRVGGRARRPALAGRRSARVGPGPPVLDTAWLPVLAGARRATAAPDRSSSAAAARGRAWRAARPPRWGLAPSWPSPSRSTRPGRRDQSPGRGAGAPAARHPRARRAGAHGPLRHARTRSLAVLPAGATLDVVTGAHSSAGRPAPWPPGGREDGVG